MKNLNVEIISATGYAFQGEASQVVVPCASGDIGVMAGHEHLIGNLREGVIEVLDDSDKKIKEIEIKSGTVEVYGENDLRVLVEI